MTTFGVELEYTLANKHGKLVFDEDQVYAVRTACKSKFPQNFDKEANPILEIVSSIHTDVNQLGEEISKCIVLLKEVASSRGFTLSDRALHQGGFPYSGMHVHVGCNSPEEALRIIEILSKLEYTSQRSSHIETVHPQPTFPCARYKTRQPTKAEIQKLTSLGFGVSGKLLLKTKNLIKWSHYSPWIVYRPEYGTVEYRKYDTTLDLELIKNRCCQILELIKHS